MDAGQFEALTHFEKEIKKLIGHREYFQKLGTKCPNIDRQIRINQVALLALSGPVQKMAPEGHTCVVLGPCKGECRK